MEHAPAAFPTMGSRTMPTNSFDIFPDSVNPSIDPTRNSAVMATSCIEGE
jgi:hypothetical protein